MKTQPIDLRKGLEQLNTRSLSKSISTLLQSKRKTIEFDPYYQRNYVWDTHKATFFIESILLGIEIPPLIMFIPANNKRKYEIIDGRQRFETLKRFFEGDFKLSKRGLRSLSGLAKLNFQNLDPDIQRIFKDTTIRIIEFSTIGEHPNQEELEDRIKKEIFWRYNSGITPLKTLEVQRAQHLGDSFTEIMREEFADHPVWLDQFKQIFFAKKDPKKLTDAECQARIRELLVLEHFPINIYATTARRRENLEWLYELYIENAEDQEQLLLTFSRKLALLHQLFLALKEKEWMIYQAVYWALVVLEQNGKNIDIFFDKQHIERLIKTILSKLDIFTGSDRSFGKNTVQRFQCLADFFNNELKSVGVEQVDFSLNLKSSLKNKRNEQKTSDVTDAIKQLDTMRLNRPDAVTKTIEDLTEDVKSHTFMIRPGYQRQEVINNKKASGIIESILLGIPLPTIFIYRRSGICEVVDGQQRLLSILAFLGRSYTNQENKNEYSKKNHYKLFKKITILKELGGRKFDDLDEKWQDCIWDFELSVVYIDEKLNDHFDPIDFFIRLNNRPYPVKDHSFEMWNSYCDRKIIKEVKEVARKHEEWFYYRKDNRRMNNEEMLTILAYLNFQSNKNIDKAFDAIEMYNWSPKPFTFRLSKILITEWLHTADRGNDNFVDREEIINSIKRVEDLILKIKILLQSLHQPASADEEELSQNFNSLLEIKGRIRQQRPFYILWFLLSGLDQQIIELHSKEVVHEVSTFFAQHQVVHEPDKGNLSIKDLFRKNVEEFWGKFTS